MTVSSNIQHLSHIQNLTNNNNTTIRINPSVKKQREIPLRYQVLSVMQATVRYALKESFMEKY
jgi:hypothetical protein